jgi:hypothetical protein
MPYLFNNNTNKMIILKTINISKKIKTLVILLLFLTTFIFLSNCSKTDPITGEKEAIETDIRKKTEQARDKSGGFFGDLEKKSSGTTFEFATSNVLWRATLQSLQFLPLANADYAGGVIIYDWYSEDPNASEQIKVSIRFLNNEIRSDSLQVLTQKKNCDTNNKCLISQGNEIFSKNIKDSILNSARLIKIEQSKKIKN